MNYAVMYEYAVDKDSRPVRSEPFNEIKNEANVFTYKDTAIVTPNSDTPYSFSVAGSACRTNRDHGTGNREGSLPTGQRVLVCYDV